MNFVSHQDHGSGTKINIVDLKTEVVVSEMVFYISWKPVRPPASVGLHKLAATKAWSCITGHMYTQKLQNSEEELTVLLQLPNDLKGLNFASISICFATNRKYTVHIPTAMMADCALSFCHKIRYYMQT